MKNIKTQYITRGQQMRYFIRLLTTNLDGTKVVTGCGYGSSQCLDDKYSQKTRTIMARRYFDRMRKIKPHVIGYAIYSGTLSNPALNHSWTFEEYRHLEHDLYDG